MMYFLETSDTIEAGHGFVHFDSVHLIWLLIGVIIIVINCIFYKKLKTSGRIIWKKVVSFLLIADEVFKIVCLLVGGNYDWCYLPLHLCSINIFLIAIHPWKTWQLLDNFLYTVCIPGALAALLFPTWTELPVLNAMHLHSFTVHILLALYPAVLTISGDIKPSAKHLPQTLLLLVCMAVPIYGINMLLGTNFMFLKSASSGNPLYWFGQNWGSHLWGFPVITAAVLIVMFVPLGFMRRLRSKKSFS